jgi:hypothetical protein
MDFDEALEKFWIFPVIALVLILGMIILSSGKHESYYVEQSSRPSLYCLYADVNWRLDPTIFCSEDFSKVVMMYLAFNSQMAGKVSSSEPPKKTRINAKEESF